MRKWVLALIGVLAAQTANAAQITVLGSFTAKNWSLLFGPASPPINQLYLSYSVSFDTSQTYSAVTAPLTIIDTNIPYPLTFSYFAGQPNFVLATFGGPLSCQNNPYSFCAFADISGGLPTFVSQSGEAGGWFAQSITPGIPAVPEPASWAMLIAGFGLVGAVARRRRTAVAA